MANLTERVLGFTDPKMLFNILFADLFASSKATSLGIVSFIVFPFSSKIKVFVIVTDKLRLVEVLNLFIF